MSGDSTGVIVGVAVFGLVLFFLFMGVRFLIRLFRRPVTEQEALQSHINYVAGQQPVGPGEGLKDKSGWAWLFWLIVSIGIAYLLISSGVLENLNLPRP